MINVTDMTLMTAMTSVTVMTSVRALSINDSADSCDNFARTALLLDITVNMAYLCICTFTVPPDWSMHVVQQLHRHRWEGHLT